MTATSASDYLADLGTLLKEEALKAKAAAAAAVETSDHPFELGRLTAYYEVLSLVKQQATAFGIPDDAIGLHAFDPDTELLARTGSTPVTRVVRAIGLDYFGGFVWKVYECGCSICGSEDGRSQSWNLYSYGRNNPFVGVDRDGRAWHVLGGALIGGGITGGVELWKKNVLLLL